MSSAPGVKDAPGYPGGWRGSLLWLSGLWILPLCWAALLILPATFTNHIVISAVAIGLAPVPALLVSSHHRQRLLLEAKQAREEAEQLKLQLESIRFRTAQLREELSAADRQARLSHQLSLLGQFTAGFLHEYNNPLAIVTNRIEVLLDERRDDAELCADLEQMLKQTRYMASIAGTLLRALRRERSGEAFTASIPSDVLAEVLESLRPSAEKQGVRIVPQMAEVPRVNLPAHVVNEVTRGLITNALQALTERRDATIWVRLEPYRAAGAKVVLKVEDDGPGVPEGIRDHLFEPFASQSPGRERLGLGLFLAASLLNTYDGTLRYEPREGGGAAFIVEMPPARFTRGQPYHWFVKGDAE
jgi:two-component system C4-dicarboxylate transport sensor histidine kinase DctB